MRQDCFGTIYGAPAPQPARGMGRHWRDEKVCCIREEQRGVRCIGEMA
jgi:hypothetical protein